MKVHYPKLYNMAHLLALYFTASKGSNNYFYSVLIEYYFILIILTNMAVTNQIYLYPSFMSKVVNI